jgi:membrane-bound ClpP family serine protease
MFRPFVIAAAKSKPPRTAEASDIAARYLVYKVYDATNGDPGAWQVLGKIGERLETVARAVERGWIIVQEEGVGRIKVQSGLLTEEGRRVARRGLR